MTHVQDLQVEIYTGNRERGFHEEGVEVREELAEAEATGDADKIRRAKRNYRNYLSNRIMLVIGEIIEAHEELRSGHDIDHEYTSWNVPDSLLLEIKDRDAAIQSLKDHGYTGKLEGPAVELADAVIRLFDIFEEIGVDLEDVIQRKLLVNAARGYRHGGRLF